MEAEPPLSPTDEELCRELGKGGTWALEVLYARYAGLVFGISRRMLASSEEAEDLTQEIFIGLQRQCGFDSTRGSMSAYLAIQTRSRALDRLRSRRSRLRMQERMGADERQPDPPSTPLDLLTLERNAQRIREALRALSEDQRRVIELAYFEGLSQTEIAARLQSPLGTVKSWTRKGLLALREQLGHLDL